MSAKYDEQGRLVEVRAKGQQESSVEQRADGTVIYKMDNKAQIFPKELVSISGSKVVND